MAQDTTGKAFSHTFVIASSAVLSTGDDKVTYTMPFDAVFDAPISACLGTLGTTGGSTIITVENVSNSQNISRNITFATTDTDRTAEGALVATAAWLTAGDGDVIGVNVDSITSGATEKHLTVTMHFTGR